MSDLWPGFDGLTITSDLPAPMRDGVTLVADIYRPATSADLPVLLMRGPYDKQHATASFGQSHPTWYANQGYLVVIQDTRGRFRSEGDFYPFAHEQVDGYDTVEWAAQLRGSTGQVGMWGFSYNGATQLLAAVERPPGLAAIAPAFTGSQYYEGWCYNRGALALAFLGYWANLLAMETALREDDVQRWNGLAATLAQAPTWFWHLPLDDYPPLKDGYAPYFFDWLAHHTYDDYWRRWSIDEDYSRIIVPGLHIGGWYDIFLGGTVQNFLGLRAGAGSEEARHQQKLLIGPWAHMPWTPLGDHEAEPPGAREVDDWHVRFFDQVLKGVDTGVFDRPVTVHLFGGGRRDFDDWPPPEAETEDWFVHSEGRANSKFGDGSLSRRPPGDESPDVYVYDPGLPTLSQGGHSCCFDSITPMGPADQHPTEVSRMVLVYTSDPFPADVDVVGDVTVTLYAASTAPDTDWTARLCVVDPAGTSLNLQEGIVRARFRTSLSYPELIRPGEVYEYRIELGPVGAHVPAGHALRLQISSSDFPQWDRNLNTGGPLYSEPAASGRLATQTVLHDSGHPTRVTLSLIGH